MFDDWYTVIKITWILIELFSIGWVLQNQNPSNLLIWPVRKEIDDTVNQSKLGANTSSWSQARVNVPSAGKYVWASTIGLGVTSVDEKWRASLLIQSLSIEI